MNVADMMPRRREKCMFPRFDARELSVKPEPDDDIKDYAETTMNELLGWYGYEKVDSRDTQGLNLQHFASTTDGAPTSPPSSVREGSDESGGITSIRQSSPNENRTPLTSRPNSASPDASLATDEVVRQHQQMVSALTSVIKRPGAPDSPNLPPGCIVCAWCQKVGMKLFTLKTPNGCKAFCSELCFTQCRRASFKKNKICDWCKHVRHTVNYVDFQDGEQQLQFCSDKCLNQYKMNIFCKETQAHLQMHTHLKEAACKMAASGSVNLITPELWLRDCKAQSNGVLNSPPDLSDHLDDNVSDDNISILSSPPRTSEKESLPPVVTEKKKHKSDFGRMGKVRDRHSRRNARAFSKHSSDRSDLENSKPSNDKKKEKKTNGMGSIRRPEREGLCASKPLPTSPINPLINGPASMIPPSQIRHPPRPSHLPHPLPPPPPPLRFGPPRFDGMRPPFLPNPFHMFAQQQMESFMRAQNRMHIRPNEQHFPMPPWSLPPFPHGPHQPPTPMPPVNVPQVPRLSKTSRSEVQNVHKSHKSHHQKHKHTSNNLSPQSKAPITTSPTTLPPQPPPPPQPSSLLPPVTVMVPFPVVLPLPLPIPIPIPVPQKLFEFFRQSKQTAVDKTQFSADKTSTTNRDCEESNRPLKLVKHDKCDKVHENSPFHSISSDIRQAQDLTWVPSHSKSNHSMSPQSDHSPSEVTFDERNNILDSRLDDSCSFSSMSENISLEGDDTGEDLQINDDSNKSSSPNFGNHSSADTIKSSDQLPSEYISALHVVSEMLSRRTPSPLNGKRASSMSLGDFNESKRHCVPETFN